MSFPNSPPEPPEAIATARVHWPIYANAALWGVGSGFVTTTLAVYLILPLRASGFVTSLFLAAPQVVGIGRLLASRISNDRCSRKRFCIAAYIASGYVLAALPSLIFYRRELIKTWKAFPGLEHSIAAPYAAIWLMVGIWCGYHLLEYLGAVALWAWLRDLIPLERRGALLGNREAWLEIGRVCGMLGTAVLTGWGDPRQLPTWAYAGMAGIGACLFVAAALPLVFLPSWPSAVDRTSPAERATRFRFSDLFVSIFDPRLSRLLLYGCWFSFFNGVTQTAQNRFGYNVLGLSLSAMLYCRVGMTTGQAVVSPWLGRLVDRFGNVRLLFICQVIVALSMFGYLLASEAYWWVIGFAWAGWIAYAGINIALPSLLLKLSPPDKAGAAIAGYFTITGLCYGASAVAGGLVFDMIRGHEFQILGQLMDRYQYMFYVGVVTRILACFFIYAIDESPVVAKSRVS
jgi:MFS family permease